MDNLTKLDKIVATFSVSTLIAIATATFVLGGNTTVLERDKKHAQVLCRNHDGVDTVRRPRMGRVVLRVTCNDQTVLSSPSGDLP